MKHDVFTDDDSKLEFWLNKDNKLYLGVSRLDDEMHGWFITLDQEDVDAFIKALQLLRKDMNNG